MPITVGVYIFENFVIYSSFLPLLFVASYTKSTILDIVESLYSLFTLQVKVPVWLILPDKISLFSFTYTGSLSPVNLEVSNADSPFIILESTGTVSPGFTIIVSPTFNSSTFTVLVSFSLTKFAVCTFSEAMLFMFLLAFSTALSSINSPNLNSNTIATLSGYSPITKAAIIAIVISVSSSKFKWNIFFIPSIIKSYPDKITANK